jgi:hypothetical protein
MSPPARSRQLGVNLIRKLARALERVERLEPSGEQPNLVAE